MSPSTRIITAALLLQLFVLGVYVSKKSQGDVVSDIRREIESHTNSLSGQGSVTAYSIINTKRINHIRKYCADYKPDLIKTYPSYERLHDVLPSWNWLASPHHHLFYCATPKCASTTWKTYIMLDLKMKWTTDTHL